jgi:hypothetical protein
LFLFFVVLFEKKQKTKMSNMAPWAELPQKRIKPAYIYTLEPDIKRRVQLLGAYLHGTLSVLPMELIVKIGKYVCKKYEAPLPNSMRFTGSWLGFQLYTKNV